MASVTEWLPLTDLMIVSWIENTKIPRTSDAMPIRLFRETDVAMGQA
jgi:hypothetical protein